jgi:pyruvate dehydrogenase E2 component (dihydrolipoamide acetyltransferase)
VPEPEEGPVTGNVQDDLGEVPVAAGDAASGSMLVGYGAKAGSISRRPRRASGTVSSAGPATDQVHESYDTATPVSRYTDEVTPSAPVSASPSGEKLPQPGRPAPDVERGRPPLAKPPVRRIARDLGIDLTQVPGSGPGGTITAEDVVTAAQGGRPSTGDRRVQLKGIRREMFRAMTASLNVPQATAFSEVDVTGTMELIENLRARREFSGLRISPLLVFAKAACLAIARNPEINSSFDEATEEIVLHGDVNLGIAAATPRGLVVPNIKRAGRMNLLELAQSLNEMVAVAKQGRVQPGDLSLGTFTITNVGVFGVDGGTPIMNPGEAAIMCLGTVRRKPWVMGTGEDEHIEIRSVCTVSLTFDHRLVDGEMGSKFLADVATIMTDPGLSLLF